MGWRRPDEPITDHRNKGMEEISRKQRSTEASSEGGQGPEGAVGPYVEREWRFALNFQRCLPQARNSRPQLLESIHPWESSWYIIYNFSTWKRLVKASKQLSIWKLPLRRIHQATAVNSFVFLLSFHQFLWTAHPSWTISNLIRNADKPASRSVN